MQSVPCRAFEGAGNEGSRTKVTLQARFHYQGRNLRISEWNLCVLACAFYHFFALYICKPSGSYLRGISRKRSHCDDMIFPLHQRNRAKSITFPYTIPVHSNRISHFHTKRCALVKRIIVKFYMEDLSKRRKRLIMLFASIQK